MSSKPFALLNFRVLNAILNSSKLSSCSEIMQLFVSLPLLGILRIGSDQMLTK